jgi:NitT/TauT family transport system substrate-binding protein
MIGEDALLAPEVLDSLIVVVNMPWFYYLDLLGTFAFAVAGFLKAHQHRYDYFGAFMLTALPAVGGGTLRDVIVGGDRHPPFVFNDPTYLTIVFAVVIVGTVLSKTVWASGAQKAALQKALDLFDTIGLAAFTVIGVKVAVVAELDWFWAPILAAMTCAGGGILSDIVLARESDVLKGELYEEVAAVGGLVLVGLLWLANVFGHSFAYIVGAIFFVLAFVFVFRIVIIKKDLRSPVLGN